MSEPTPTSAPQPSLVRAMGLGMAVALVVGNVIGSGIFAKPGRIAAEAGDFGLIITAWVTGGVLALMGALSIAELAAMLPHAGGLYVYLREAYGRGVAFLFGWADVLFQRPASTGALGVMCVTNLAAAIGWQASPSELVLAAGAVIVGLATVNILGVAWGGRMQAVTTVLKVGFIVMIIVLPGLMWLLGMYQPQWSNFGQGIADPGQKTLLTQFTAALLAVSWAYNGWDGITPLAEEIKEPQRNVPRALFLGIGVLALLYISANLAYHLVVPMSEMVIKDHQKLVATLTLTELLGPIGRTLMSIGVMLSTLGAMNGNLLYGPRVSFAMGRDKVFFSQLGAVHSTFRTPAFAITVQAVMALLLVGTSFWLTANVASFKDKALFDLLTDYVVFSASLFYVSSVAAVFVLRKKHPEWPRPYRTWGYPWLPAAYVVFYAWFLGMVFVGNWQESVIGIGLIVLGIPVYWIWNRRQVG